MVELYLHSSIYLYGIVLNSLRARVPFEAEARFSLLQNVETRPPIQRVEGRFPLTVKRRGREAFHSPPSSAEVKNGGAISPILDTSS
jgi:hypothetical protein